MPQQQGHKWFAAVYDRIMSSAERSFMKGVREEIAGGAGRPIAPRQASAEEIPFEDASFDTVVSTLVMCSVADPGRALSEARRVLKPSGKLRLYDHVRYDHPSRAF